MASTAGIAIIGDEILSGKFPDENGPFLIRELAALGVALGRIEVIPDDVGDIGDTVRALSRRFDWVFTSGGVGPTHDDMTMAGVARAFDTRVIIHPALEQVLRAYWGPEMPEANVKLAAVPDGAELVEGEGLRWPVVCFRNVYILPGVPRLFRKKFEGIRDRFRGEPRAVCRVYAAGEEGALAPHMDAVVAAHPAVKVGSYPRIDETEYRVLITLESVDPAAARAASADLQARLGALLVRAEGPTERA